MSPGALLRRFARIRDGRPDSWTATFSGEAPAASARAAAAESSGKHAIAAQEWAACALAHRAVLMMQDPSTSAARDSTDAMQEAFRSHLRCADVSLTPWSIPFRNGYLPAYVFPSLHTADTLFVILGDGDTYVEDLWFFGGQYALEQEWPVLLVDLPGQGSTPDQRFHFGPQTLDGLHVTLDAVRARGFAGEIVLCGWSGGDLFATKYASLARPEDRIRAWIASTPIHDAQQFLTTAMPAVLRRDPSSLLARMVLRVASSNKTLRAALPKYDWQFGPGGVPHMVSTFVELGRTNLDEVDAPVLGLVGSSEDTEALRQATTVVDAVRRRHPESELHSFDTGSGADSQCHIGNLTLAMSTIFDWLRRVGFESPHPMSQQ